MVRGNRLRALVGEIAHLRVKDGVKVIAPATCMLVVSVFAVALQVAR